MNKNKVVVHLMGRDYTLVTDQQPDKVQRLSRYVDRRMRELAILTRAGENMLPVLTAMTLADELFTAQDEVNRLRRELDAAKAETKQSSGGAGVVALRRFFRRRKWNCFHLRETAKHSLRQSLAARTLSIWAIRPSARAATRGISMRMGFETLWPMRTNEGRKSM